MFPFDPFLCNNLSPVFKGFFSSSYTTTGNESVQDRGITEFEFTHG